MSKVLKGSFGLMKQLNIVAVLKSISENGSLSRADIAKLTGLTPASITNIAKELIEDGYLIESKLGESSGGRPPIILEINPDGKYVIGVSIGLGIIEVVITNLFARIDYKEVIEVSKEKLNKEFIFNELVKIINKVIKNSEIDKEKILGIGVALHGIVDAKTGISKYAPYYGWENVNIKEILEKEFEYPVYIDNDVRAMALGESSFGIAKDISNFVTISISNGIGAGIIINNSPYYGVDFSAGEIGHIVVEPNGEICNCGNYGCLETLASNNSIISKIIKAIKEGQDTLLQKENIDTITIEDICSAAENGDELCVSILKDAARYIGLAISNLINILNPMAIVVVGEIFENSTHVTEELRKIIENRTLRLSSENINIIKSVLKNNAATIGAATLVIREVFNGEI